jgi:hypothetical protein
VGGSEHAGAGVDVLTDVLGADKGVVTAEFEDLAFEETAVVAVVASDLAAIDDKYALEAVLLLPLKGEAFLALEEGVGSPGSAGEETGGVACGGHGGEAPVIDGAGDVLGFVDDEEAVGGGTDDIGGGVTGEVGDAGEAVAVDVSMLAVEARFVEEATLKGALFEAVHGVNGLGVEGGLDADDGAADLAQAGEEEEDEVRDHLVLAGLAGKEDDEGFTVAGEDGAGDGFGGADLVGAEADAEKAFGESGDGTRAESQFPTLVGIQFGEEGFTFFRCVGGHGRVLDTGFEAGRRPRAGHRPAPTGG